MSEVHMFDRRSRFSSEAFDQIVPLAQPWRVKGILPARGVAFLVGQSKAGKTFVALDTALQLAAGDERIFERKAQPCGAVYVAAEDPGGCRARVAAWRQKHERVSATPFELISQAPKLLDPNDMADFRGALAEVNERVKAMGAPLGLVVIDTLSRCIPGVEENSSADISCAFAALNDLADALGVLILVVAHFGKAGADKGIRGWSGLDANSDATITVERNSADPDLRTLTFAKVKNGVDGETLGFRLEQADIGIIDEDGEVLTSCVVVYETSTTRRTKALTEHEKIVLAAITHLTAHGPTQPAPTGTGQMAVTRADVRTCAINTGLALDGEKTNTTNQRMSRTINGLVKRGMVGTNGTLIWLTAANDG